MSIFKQIASSSSIKSFYVIIEKKDNLISA